MANKRGEEGGLWALLVISLVLLVGSITLTLVWNRYVTDVERSQGWISTTGTVLSAGIKVSEVERCSGSGWAESCATTTNYCPQVEYEYVVADRQYNADRLSFGSSCYEHLADAESFLQRYESGAAVEVFYDPEEPSSAILVKESPLKSPGWLVGLFWFAIIGSLAGCLGTAFTIWRHKVRRKPRLS